MYYVYIYFVFICYLSFIFFMIFLFYILFLFMWMRRPGERTQSGASAREYRSCPLFKTNIALAATLRGRPDTKEAIAKRSKEFNEKRWKTQPKEASAGCISEPFPELPAGKLIEELGLKGTRGAGRLYPPCMAISSSTMSRPRRRMCWH